MQVIILSTILEFVIYSRFWVKMQGHTVIFSVYAYNVEHCQLSEILFIPNVPIFGSAPAFKSFASITLRDFSLLLEYES